jgi:hypothetical protein
VGCPPVCYSGCNKPWLGYPKNQPYTRPTRYTRPITVNWGGRGGCRSCH